MVNLIIILNYKIFFAEKSRQHRKLNPDLPRVNIHVIHKLGSFFSLREHLHAH